MNPANRKFKQVNETRDSSITVFKLIISTSSWDTSLHLFQLWYRLNNSIYNNNKNYSDIKRPSEITVSDQITAYFNLKIW